MPGSPTTPDRTRARDSAPMCVAFRSMEYVGIRDMNDFVAQWLACPLPCRRFSTDLAINAARLGANVVR